MIPGIFHKGKFVYDWKVSGDNGVKIFDFLSYMVRPEAFEPDKHMSQLEYVYSEFIPHEKSQAQDIKSERSFGAFTTDKDKLSEDELNKVRDLERISRAEGCPKYVGVISFDNSYLRENNFIIGNQLNTKEVIAAARKGINAMIDRSDKLEASNCYWVGSIHVNTGNVHIHYQLMEYHRFEDRCVTRKKQGKDLIEMKAMRGLKSTIGHYIDKSAIYKNLTAFQRDVLAPKIEMNFSNSITKINNLIDKLPSKLKNGNYKQWAYGRQSEAIQDKIKECINSVISDDNTLQIMFDTYVKQLEKAQQLNLRR